MSGNEVEDLEVRLSTDMETKSDRERYILVAAIDIITSEGSWNIYFTEVYKAFCPKSQQIQLTRLSGTGICGRIEINTSSHHLDMSEEKRPYHSGPKQ